MNPSRTNQFELSLPIRTPFVEHTIQSPNLIEQKEAFVNSNRRSSPPSFLCYLFVLQTRVRFSLFCVCVWGGALISCLRPKISCFPSKTQKLVLPPPRCSFLSFSLHVKNSDVQITNFDVTRDVTPDMAALPRRRKHLVFFRFVFNL